VLTLVGRLRIGPKDILFKRESCSSSSGGVQPATFCFINVALKRGLLFEHSRRRFSFPAYRYQWLPTVARTCAPAWLATPRLCFSSLSISAFTALTRLRSRQLALVVCVIGIGWRSLPRRLGHRAWMFNTPARIVFPGRHRRRAGHPQQ